MLTTIPCPNCKKPVVWSKDSTFRPFCSERCRLIDLGAWADGSYAIPISESPTTDSAPLTEGNSTEEEDD